MDAMQVSSEPAANAVVRRTLTVDEVAQMMGISSWGAREAIKRGEIPSIRIGHRLLVPRIPFERMLAGE